tara:strand:+ start:111 stop:1049 length:939 start_codon:yes stop_codon:yes gene_type:complete
MSVIEKLSAEHSVEISGLRRFSRFAPHHYKIYTIPKRSVGHRVIAHPSKKLKSIQRTLNKILADILPVHDAAFAYRKNRGIKDNARRHAKNPYLLKMDFKNYFMSISPPVFWEMIRQNSVEIPREERKILERLLFWCPSKRLSGKLVLSVGAPTSPLISNFIAFKFDEMLTEYCDNRDIVYTRYSDDLTFTSRHKGVLFDLPGVVSDCLKESIVGYVSINEAKTVFSSKAHNRHVTGITLTPDNKLSIGRDRKRYISALTHKYCAGRLPKEDISHLQGLLAFAENIEPGFIERLKVKYTKDSVSKLIQGRTE